MKKIFEFAVVALVAFSVLSCGPKPAYKTSEGKKKLEHYNKLQYGEKKKY